MSDIKIAYRRLADGHVFLSHDIDSAKRETGGLPVEYVFIDAETGAEIDPKNVKVKVTTDPAQGHRTVTTASVLDPEKVAAKAAAKADKKAAKKAAKAAAEPSDETAGGDA